LPARSGPMTQPTVEIFAGVFDSECMVDGVMDVLVHDTVLTRRVVDLHPLNAVPASHHLGQHHPPCPTWAHSAKTSCLAPARHAPAPVGMRASARCRGVGVRRPAGYIAVARPSPCGTG
jgi:hypothetical protein